MPLIIAHHVQPNTAGTLRTAMIIDRFGGRNLRSRDAAYYPSTIKFDPFLLHRGLRPGEKVCNGVWSPTVIFLHLFWHSGFSPCGIFHVNSLAFALFYSLSLKFHHKLSVEKFSREIYPYILVLPLKFESLRSRSLPVQPSSKNLIDIRDDPFQEEHIQSHSCSNL